MSRPTISLLILILPLFAQAGALGYYREPALSGDRVVFCAEGDLWTVDAAGGVASRLTSHPGAETSPAISPDGKTVAFCATYEGPTEVYTMPIAGGLPARWTFEGLWTRVCGWTPAGEILYATSNHSTLPSTQLMRLDPQTGDRSLLPLAQGADGVFDREGRRLFFTRFARQGSKTKRYTGGTAENLWRWDGGSAEAVPLSADYAGTSREAMFWDDRVYFVSDRGGSMNLWSMNAEGGDLRRHTGHEEWDVLEPDLSEGRIVYRIGADLRLFDIASGADTPIPITLVSDLDQTRERWVTSPMDYLTAAHLSADGERLALTARGQVFVAPVGQGRLVEATRESGVRYRQAWLLPGEDALLTLSDESGEVEWWQIPLADGERRQVTHDGKVLRFSGTPSPDGKWIVHNDQDQELWLTSVASGKSERIDFSGNWSIGPAVWSADSRWFAYSRPGDNGLSRIFLHDTETGAHAAVTSDRYDSSSPAFDPGGDWLYFLSDRHFVSRVDSPWGSRQPEPYFDETTKVYYLALREGLRSPFRADDELYEPTPEEEAPDESKENETKRRASGGKSHEDASGSDEKEKLPAIELAGLSTRLHEAPVPPGNYGSLSATASRLLFVSREGDDSGLLTLAIGNDDPEPERLLDGIASYELSLDGSKLLIRKGDRFHVVDADASGVDLDESAVDLGGWVFSLNPREEWRQMFVESWRLARDYFYDPGMHGVDWREMLARHLPLLDRVTTRAELSDLQAQMAGELSALHTYIYGGDHREGQDDVSPASLGAELRRVADGYLVEHVYRTDPDRPGDMSPLARPGLGISEGDLILAVNGVAANGARDMGELLRNQAGKQVRLRVRPADGDEPNDHIVEPISGRRARDLRYGEWEYTRRLRTDDLGGGRIGYVHLQDMGQGSMADWHRDYYPVFRRQGLIIDMRHNNGGNIDSWILSRLLRKAWLYWQPRVGDTYWNMQYAFRGHMVVLIDEWTASDGEAFAEGFRRLGLGEVIGTRTWGGEIWLTSSNILVDEGIVTAAEFGSYGAGGTWLIEGHGVDPDQVVDNLPAATFRGEDAQLEAAIRHLERLIAEDPRPVPVAPGYPNKSRAARDGN